MIFNLEKAAPSCNDAMTADETARTLRCGLGKEGFGREMAGPGSRACDKRKPPEKDSPAALITWVPVLVVLEVPEVPGVQEAPAVWVVPEVPEVQEDKVATCEAPVVREDKVATYGDGTRERRKDILA